MTLQLPGIGIQAVGGSPRQRADFRRGTIALIQLRTAALGTAAVLGPLSDAFNEVAQSTRQWTTATTRANAASDTLSKRIRDLGNALGLNDRRLSGLEQTFRPVLAALGGLTAAFAAIAGPLAFFGITASTVGSGLLGIANKIPLVNKAIPGLTRLTGKAILSLGTLHRVAFGAAGGIGRLAVAPLKAIPAIGRFGLSALNAIPGVSGLGSAVGGLFPRLTRLTRLTVQAHQVLSRFGAANIGYRAITAGFGRSVANLVVGLRALTTVGQAASLPLVGGLAQAIINATGLDNRLKDVKNRVDELIPRVGRLSRVINGLTGVTDENAIASDSLATILRTALGPVVGQIAIDIGNRFVPPPPVRIDATPPTPHVLSDLDPSQRQQATPEPFAFTPSLNLDGISASNVNVDSPLVTLNNPTVNLPTSATPDPVVSFEGTTPQLPHPRQHGDPGTTRRGSRGPFNHLRAADDQQRDYQRAR